MRKYILRSEMEKRISKIWKSNPYETKMKANIYADVCHKILNELYKCEIYLFEDKKEG